MHPNRRYELLSRHDDSPEMPTGYSGMIVLALLPALAVALGITSGALLAQVATVTPPTMLGRVSGVVAGVAGLAGFLSPLLMAASLSRYGNYGPAVGVLAAGAAAALLSASTATRPSVARGARSPMSGAA